jgi:hypothetical protein
VEAAGRFLSIVMFIFLKLIPHYHSSGNVKVDEGEEGDKDQCHCSYQLP